MKTNDRYEVLTLNGYKSFSGVSCKISNTTYRIITESFDEIIATENHMFQCIDNSYISVKELFLSNNDIKLKIVGSIVDISKLNKEQNVYDILDVQDTNSFIANNFISHNCSFLGSGSTLISANCLLGLQGVEPAKRQYDIKYYEDPVEGHDYIMTVDVSKGRGQDYSTFTVFDVSSTPFKTVCTYRDNLISPLIYPELIVRAGKQYNNAMIVIENNDAGQVVCNAVYYEYEYDNMFVSSAVKSNGIGVMMTKRVKRIGCSNLKDLIESGKLNVCDMDTIIELSTFEPHGDSYAARGSKHDDMVMNLVMFAWFVSTEAFGGISNIDLKQLLYSEKIREMDEDVPLFGIINNYVSDAPQSSQYYEEALEQNREWNGL
jgi:hypothetical protein